MLLPVLALPLLPPGQIDVAAVYGARGDGRADDTAALQRALDEHSGSGRVLYLRPGTYLVSRPLAFKVEHGIWGNNHLWGAGVGRTTIRLRDGAFADPTSPKPILTLGRHASADWFHNSVQGLTLNAGRGNPGAVGIEFYSNNTGVLRDVAVTSGDGQGRIGVDLAHGDMNGPLLVQRVSVKGFDVGVRCGYAVNSQTMEDVALSGQRETGLLNEGQCLAVRGLRSDNAVPAVRNLGGASALALLDSDLRGSGPTAVLNTGYLAAQNVRVVGYRAGLSGTKGVLVKGSIVDWASHGRGPKVARLAVKDAPECLPGGRSVLATDFGAVPNDGQDDADALQRAFDSGADEVVLPRGQYQVGKPLTIPPTLRRLDGQNSYVVPLPSLDSTPRPEFRLVGKGSPFFMERVTTGFNAGPFWFLQNDAARTLVVRDTAINFQGADAYRNAGRGEVFLENVTGHAWTFTRQSVWARQMNVENQGTHVRNVGGRLWVLGLKTERGGTLVDTGEGGATEIAGGFCYTTTPPGGAPMFKVSKGTLSVTLAEACYGGEPYRNVLEAGRTLVQADFPPRQNGVALTRVTARAP